MTTSSYMYPAYILNTVNNTSISSQIFFITERLFFLIQIFCIDSWMEKVILMHWFPCNNPLIWWHGQILDILSENTQQINPPKNTTQRVAYCLILSLVSNLEKACYCSQFDWNYLRVSKNNHTSKGKKIIGGLHISWMVSITESACFFESRN